MNTFQKTLFLGLACFALTACGGTGGSASAAPSPGTPVASDGLGGTPGQPFAQRLAQTEYPKSLVNDPEAMKRILGEDKDNNGIRDDVDTFIATLTTDLVELKAFQQYAKTLQGGLLVNSKVEAAQFGDRLVRVSSCFLTIAENFGTRQDVLIFMSKAHNKKQQISRQTINSVERVARMDQVDVLAHGYVIESATANPKSCD